MKRSRWKGGVAPRAPVPASRRRGAATFGALVTHRTDLQPLLPQVVIGNKHVLPQALCAEVKEAVSPVVHVWAEKSGWMCERLLVKYLALVADVFDSRPACQPIVLLDCAPAHLGEAVSPCSSRARPLHMFRASWLHSSGTTFGCWVFFAFESIFET